MRNKIKEKLFELGDRLYYGMVPDNIVNEDDWNFIVFGQSRVKKKDVNSNDLQGYWYVTIAREDFIPDDVVFDVIEKMTSIDGLRLADGECQYTYTTKGSTNIIVEILELQFTKTKKRC